MDNNVISNILDFLYQIYIELYLYISDFGLNDNSRMMKDFLSLQ